MVRRADDFGALAAADPARYHHRLGAHVLEPVALHRVGGPGNRAPEGFRPPQAIPMCVGERRKGQPEGEIPPIEHPVTVVELGGSRLRLAAVWASAGTRSEVSR